MKNIVQLFTAALIILSLAVLSYPQAQGELSSHGFTIKPGIHFEYFDRTITWDDDEQESQLQSMFIVLNTGFQTQGGFSLHAILGYSLSNFDALVFRELPFSVELDVGRIEGFVLGAEVEKGLFSTGSMEIGIFGQILYNKVKQKTWDIPGLSVEGTVTGKPSWIRASAGPVFKYTGFDAFHPYARVCYNKLWGTFEMEQTIQDLEGMEEKDIKAKSQFDAALGTLFHLSRAFSLKGEVHLMPYDGGVDIGFLFGAFLSF
jgi:hypothetical protein